MKIAISQPTYLPWLGFFDLIDQVDRFVLLDDAQFVKQSWHQRNRIKSSKGLQWLTVPVIFRGRLGQPICDVEIRDPEFWKTHVRAIEVNYGRARYFQQYFPFVREILATYGPQGKLIELNLALIRWLAQELEIRTPMVQSSRLGAEGARASRLVAICKLLGASDYVSPRSATYLLDDLALFAEQGQRVWFQNYTHPEYDQRFPPFSPFASVLDLLFNQGGQSGNIMRGGRGQPFAPDDVRTMSATTECTDSNVSG